MTKLEEFKSQLAKAKIIQGSTQANPNLKDHANKNIIVCGMHVTENIKVGTLTVSKITYSLQDGTALDSFYMSAVESARELIAEMGEGPYLYPLEMFVMEVTTNRGPRQYCQLIGMVDTGETISEVIEQPVDSPQEPDPEK